MASGCCTRQYNSIISTIPISCPYRFLITCKASNLIFNTLCHIHCPCSQKPIALNPNHFLSLIHRKDRFPPCTSFSTCQLLIYRLRSKLLERKLFMIRFEGEHTPFSCAKPVQFPKCHFIFLLHVSLA